MSNPQFVVYCGPMFSGKTSRMLMELEKYRYQKKNICVFKPVIDDRYDIDNVVTHSGWSTPAIPVRSAKDMIGVLKELGNLPDVVAIDEAFMIHDVSDAALWLYMTGISVIVSTIDLSFAGNPFSELQRMLPYATKIEKCTAVCTVCQADACYTHKKNVSDEDTEITVGGHEMYEPRCWKHFVFNQNDELNARNNI
jgi:thymidine kinase